MDTGARSSAWSFFDGGGFCQCVPARPVRFPVPVAIGGLESIEIRVAGGLAGQILGVLDVRG